jgi:hypothetical protein
VIIQAASCSFREDETCGCVADTASLRLLPVLLCAAAGSCCRFAGLLSFNDVAISQAEVAAAAELFGPLDAALAAALVSGRQA